MFIKALLCIDWLIFIKPGSRTDAYFQQKFLQAATWQISALP